MIFVAELYDSEGLIIGSSQAKNLTSDVGVVTYNGETYVANGKFRIDDGVAYVKYVWQKHIHIFEIV